MQLGPSNNNWPMFYVKIINYSIIEKYVLLMQNVSGNVTLFLYGKVTVANID